MMNKGIKFFIAILSCQFAGVFGSLFTSPNINGWYSELAKPIFSPPNWLFGPVWISLYLLMGISLYLLWTSKRSKKAIELFVAQLIVNALWSFIFFGLQSPLLGFIWILILLLLIIFTMIETYKVNKVSMYILIPYLIWVSFATILNLAIFILN